MIVTEQETFFTPIYHAAYDYTSRYTARTILRSLEGAGLQLADKGVTLSEVSSQLGVIEPYHSVLEWAFAFLLQEGFVIQEHGQYRKIAVDEEERFDYLNVNIHPSIALLDYLQEYWCDILSGQVNALPVLFNAKGSALWDDYFNNQHDLYAVHNQWVAERLVDLMNGLPKRVLELGTGYGSGSEAVLSECILRGINVQDYVLSDISPALLRRSKKRLAEQFFAVSFASATLDIDRLAAEPEKQYDLIFAVNVLHCSQNLEATVRKLRDMLKPNGSLILSECVRSTYEVRLHQEYIFSLLPGFTNRNPDQQAAPCFGFLRAEEWQSVLQKSGFENVCITVNPGTKTRGAIIEGRNKNAS